jgi:transcriptional repressor OPI1
MEALRPDPPPEYTAHHDPDSFLLPSVPNHKLTTPPVSLPDIRSLRLPNTRPAPLQHVPPPSQWTQSSSQILRLPPITPKYNSTFAPLSSPMETDGVMPDRMRQPSIVSMDDMEAAEALTGMKTGGSSFPIKVHQLTLQYTPNPSNPSQETAATTQECPLPSTTNPSPSSR